MPVRSYEQLLARVHSVSAPSVRVDAIGSFAADGRDYPMQVISAGRPDDGRKGVMIAAGIHGDEPAGVEAAMRFVETQASDEALLSRFHFVIFPCNNPTGWERNTRENWQGVDLNRQFNTRKPAAEVALIMRALEGRCFDLVFEMHEDIDAQGFYMYEISDDAGDHVGEQIIQAVRRLGCPINMNDCIEGAPADGGLIRRRLDVSNFRKTRLPQAIYTYRTCGGHVITLEPPAALLPLEQRVEIELMALSIALESQCQRR